MPKRKREDISRVDNYDAHSKDRLVAGQRAQLDTVLIHGQKILARALKIGRGFERQKLGRRQKTATKNNGGAEIAKLNQEVVALKGLNLKIAAKLHLFKTLAKTKSLSSSPAFPDYITAEIGSLVKPQDAASANVTARLYNSNPVKTAMTDLMRAVREALGVEGPKINGGENIESPHGKGDRIQENAKDKEVDKNNVPRPLESPVINTKGSSSSENDHNRDLSIDRNAEDGVGYRQYDSRLADTSSEDGSQDELNTSCVETQKQSTHHTDIDFSPSPPLSLSPSQSSRSSPLPDWGAERIKTANARSAMFLPSLMGGYWSGSEPGDDVEDAGAIKPKKNRMGQQARRQLWEKKFGQRAKHLKSAGRNQGWDSRRGAQGSDERRKRTRGGDKGRGNSRSQDSCRNSEAVGGSGPNVDAVKQNLKPQDVPLHPSWEAAKKAKAQKQTAPFQGKKTTFD